MILKFLRRQKCRQKRKTMKQKDVEAKESVLIHLIYESVLIHLHTL